MKKKTRFDFNKLIDLYKEDLPNGRIYLYENLNVFLMYTWIRLYDYAHRKMEDVIHDAYMFIDAHIIKSIDKWFGCRINKYEHCYCLQTLGTKFIAKYWFAK